MLKVRNLTKTYGNETAIEGISFEVENSEFTTLLGPSGCGKTTVLKIVAGLEEPDGGSVIIRNEDVTEAKTEERRIGMVFQSSSLFPRMTVRENIDYALRPHLESKSEREERVNECIELVRLSDKADAHPKSLSGGESRRAELARALSYEPDVMLLDEPLTGLDRGLRTELRTEIKRIQVETGVTMLFVTHDQEEAISVSDSIVVLNDGRKEQEGRPEEVYRRPRTRFVAEFLGEATRFDGVVEDDSLRTERGDRLRVNGRSQDHEGEKASVYIRPEDVEILNGRRNHDNIFSGEVVEVTEMGSYAEMRVRTEAGEVLCKVDGFSDVGEGENVTVGFNDSDTVLVVDG